MDVLPSYTLLDGAVTTNFYGEGMALESCITTYILDNPHIITKLQSDFINAGSDIIYAPTAQANRQLLRQFGLEHNVAKLNKHLVNITKGIAQGKYVAGSLSPTGLSVIPYGTTELTELINIYTEQAAALDDAGVDLFVLEAMTSLCEARAAVFACLEFNKPIYVTFYINERGKTEQGATPLNCLIALQDLGISAFGLSCSGSPLTLKPYIKELFAFSKIPIIAKPNAGMPNPLLPNVYDLSPCMMAEQMEELLECGATIIGGCCGTTPEHISAMRKLLDQYKKPISTSKELQSNDIILASETAAFSLDNDRIDFSTMITCEHDMADTFIDIEDDSIDIMLIKLDTIDDAIQFSLNAHLAILPICFHATNEQALSTALRLYHGKAMIDTKSPIDIDILTALAKKFGAVMY